MRLQREADAASKIKEGLLKKGYSTLNRAPTSLTVTAVTAQCNRTLNRAPM